MDKPIPHTIEQLRKVRQQVEFIGSRFTSPDDDWVPCLQLFSREKMHICGLAGEWFDSPEMKAQIPVMIANLAKQFKAVSGALIISQWTVRIDITTPGGKAAAAFASELGIQQHPKHQEQVMVEISDRKVSETWEAEIIRYPDNPPTLGKWRLRDDCDIPQLLDIPSDVIYKALKKAKGD